MERAEAAAPRSDEDGGGGGGTERSAAAWPHDGSLRSKMETASRLCPRARDPVDGREMRPAEAYALSEGVLFGSRASQQTYFDLLEEGVEMIVKNGQPRQRALERATLWTREVALRGKASKQQFVVAPALAAGAYVFMVRSQLDAQLVPRRRKAAVEIQVLEPAGTRCLLRKTLVLDRKHPQQRADFEIGLDQEGSILLATFSGSSMMKTLTLRAEVTCLETPAFVRKTAKARRRSRSLLRDQEYMVEIIKDASGIGMSLCWNERAQCALVGSVARHGPADQTAMIEVGDRLRSIQGLRVDNIPFAEQLQMIRDVPKYLILIFGQGLPRMNLTRSRSLETDLGSRARLSSGHVSSSSFSSSLSLASKGSRTSASSPERVLDLDFEARSETSNDLGETKDLPDDPAAPLVEAASLALAPSSPAAKASSARVCAVCMQSDAVHAMSLACAAGHVVCADCVTGFVAFASSVGNEAQLGPDNQSLRCVLPKCSAPPISAFELARHVPQDAFQDLLRAGLRNHEQVVLKAERDRHELRDSAVQKHVNYVANEILTLKCPRNGHPFFDFDGCLALSCTRCRPQCYFCAWCLKDCGQAAHAHVIDCPASPRPGLLYATLTDVHNVHTARAQKLFVTYWRETVAPEPKHIRESVLDQLRATHRDILGPVLPEDP